MEAMKKFYEQHREKIFCDLEKLLRLEKLIREQYAKPIITDDFNKRFYVYGDNFKDNVINKEYLLNIAHYMESELKTKFILITVCKGQQITPDAFEWAKDNGVKITQQEPVDSEKTMRKCMSCGAQF